MWVTGKIGFNLGITSVNKCDIDKRDYLMVKYKGVSYKIKHDTTKDLCIPLVDTNTNPRRHTFVPLTKTKRLTRDSIKVWRS